MPPISRVKKRTVDTTNKKIDSYFKPMTKTKRKIENDENCQENVRPSPSPPNSQQQPLKTFGEKAFGLKSDKENIGSSNKPFGLSRKDTENNGCKTFGTTNALMWQKFDRQPLREKSIKPVNTLKLNTITNKSIQTTFNVLSDKDIENGLEDSLGTLKRSDEGELNTQFIEESDTLDSNYIIDSPSILSYHSDNDTNDTFKDDADQDQISDSVGDDITNSDDDDKDDGFSTQDPYGYDDTDSVTSKSNDQGKIDVYRDDDEPVKFKVYVDQDESDNKEEYDSSPNDAITFKVYVDPELRKDNCAESKEDQEQQPAETSNNTASPNTEEPKKPLLCLPQSVRSIPDFFSDDEDKEDSGSTFGSKGVFDEEEEFDYRLIPVQTEEFSITGDSIESLGPTPEFKEPLAPIFSSNYKQLLKDRERS